MKKYSLLFFIFFPLFVFSQEEAWVYFNAKANEHYYYENPLQMLSQRALDRRNTQNIALDFKDVPINQEYIDSISSVSGIKVMAKSKWLNAIHVRGIQSLINSLKNFDFVDRVDFANKNLNQTTSLVSVNKKNSPRKNNSKKEKIVSVSEGFATQIEILNGQFLHQQNFTGSGKIIAVLDSGFLGVDTSTAFKRLRENKQILDGYNFVKRNTSYYADDNHGTNVLSTMAAYGKNSLVGTAIDASYYLFVTEDVTVENPVEESLWVEAAEKADSLGVDIISSSLGYSDFDNPNYNYNYTERNGMIAFISRGAEIAFSRGMLVVVSAGNEGTTRKPYIGVPADAPSVVSVGAVNDNENRAGFSSIGPTADGRIKPEVMALGQNTIVSDKNGNNIYLSGSSFSAPIISGMLACLWQAYPDKTNQEIRTLLLQSSNKNTAPDNEYGYGIPDFNLALSNGNSLKRDVLQHPTSPFIKEDFPANSNSGIIFFNSFSGQKTEDLQENFSLESLRKGLYFYKKESDVFSKCGKIIKN
ncbi:S8 family serine peptidase [Flavobacterium sp. FZUC8N2.13]|uniref:S8 family serine peptidase n=1 Tax=Flavobacterium zubiriense TaxID=3138075 RepID=A0ABV4TAX7_9FLAO